MHKNTTKCNKTQSKWCINKHGASKIIDTFETYQISLVQKNRPLVARCFRLFWRGFSTPSILCHYSRRNGGVVRHVTIIPSAGGAVAVSRHCFVHLVACGTTPLSLSHAPLDRICGTTLASILFQASLACGHQIWDEKSLHIDYDWKSLHIDYDWKSLHIDYD
jgi:hypothetical protein